MNIEEKKELLIFEQKTKQLKTALAGSLISAGIAIPFLYMIVGTTSLIIPIIICVIGGFIGYNLNKLF